MNGQRIRIGRFNDAASRQTVYQTGEALEVDEVDHFSIVRRRVFFDDVLLVTRHRAVGTAFVGSMAIFAFVFVFIGWMCKLAKEPEAGIVCASLSVPFLLALVTRLVLKVEILTVYGRRSKAAMKVSFRKGYSRRKFEEICALVAQAQERVAAEAARRRPPFRRERKRIPCHRWRTRWKGRPSQLKRYRWNRCRSHRRPRRVMAGDGEM